MLHIAERGLATEKSLRRLTTYFYCQGRGFVGGDEARKRHVELQAAFNGSGGLIRSCIDARAICKAICTLHRLPSELLGSRAFKLQGLPYSLLTIKMASPVQKRLAFAVDNGKIVATPVIKRALAAQVLDESSKEEVVARESGLLEGYRSVSMDVHAKQEWSEDVKTNVLAAFVAHGGGKALAIESELKNYEVALALADDLLTLFVAALGDALDQCQGRGAEPSDCEGEMVAVEIVESNDDEEDELHGSHKGWETLFRKHAQALTSAQECNFEVLRWVRKVLGCAASDVRLFVAGDLHGMADVAPAAFAQTIPRLLAKFSGTAVAHGPALESAIGALDEWPPPSPLPQPLRSLAITGSIECGKEDGCAAGVQAGSRPRAEGLKTIPFEGQVPCARCARTFHHIWVVSGICFRCERDWRARGVCPFRVECPPGAWCPHDGRCVVCDHHSCSACRLHHGDGEAVECLYETLSALASADSKDAMPVTVLLDWDRTCCTTKLGSSPLSGNHTLDESLLGLLVASSTQSQFPYPEGANGVNINRPPPVVEIVTRNGHVDDIRVFLERHGAHGIPIHSVTAKQKEASGGRAHTSGAQQGAQPRRPRSKAEVVCRAAAGPVVFVDDNIAELVHPEIAAAPWVHCVFFSRGPF